MAVAVESPPFECAPSSDTAPARLGMLGLLGRCLSYLRPYWPEAALILVGLLAELVFYVFLPISFKFIIDRAIIPRDSALLSLVLGALAGAFVLAALAGLGRDFLGARVGAKLLNELRFRMFEQLQRLPLDFYARVQVGDVMARFSSDLTALETALLRAVPAVVSGGLQVCVSMVLLLLLDWRLTLVALATLPLALLGPRRLGPRAAQASYDRKQYEARLASLVQEHVGAQPVVRAFGLQSYALGRFGELLDQLARSSIRSSFAASLVGRSTEATVNLIQLLLIGIGAILAFNDQLSVGALIAFIGTFFNLGLATLKLSEAMPQLLQATGGMQRIDELLNEPPGVADVPDAAALPRIQRGICLQDVSFGYGGERAILDRVSLAIPAGRTTALVGISGSGKSTVLNLIARFYDPERGAVQIDGHDLRRVTGESLRAQIGTVFQETVLFNTTIRENIRLGKPEASDAEVEEAARAAEIHDDIVRLPREYETEVGERGGRLSGGQRQRLALARAVLRQPALLLLDEATSALDTATEAAIQATLARLAQGRTLVSVTHRLATAAQADRIFVLNRGRVEEEGSHEALLRRGGLYYQLWQQQSGFVISPDGRRAEVETSRLAAIPLFAALEPAHLAALAERFVSERYVADRTIFEEGDPGDKFYLIVRGVVEVTKVGPSGRAERLAALHDGDFFGEIALLEDVPRTATIRTRTASLMLTLGRHQFDNVLAEVPGLREIFEQTAAIRRQEQVALMDRSGAR